MRRHWSAVRPSARSCSIKDCSAGASVLIRCRHCALISGLGDAARSAGVPFCGDSEGGMMGFFLLDSLPSTYSQVMKSDGAKFNQLFHGLLDRGVYIAPALYEAGFVSAAHTDADIAATVDAARAVFQTLG